MHNISIVKLLCLVAMLEDTPLRLVDIALESLSTSLYRARNVQVTAILEDMVYFFTYRDFTVI